MTDQQTLFDTTSRPRPIKRGSPAAARFKVGSLNATKRSLNYLRKDGWTVDVAEKFVTHGGTRAQETYIDELLSQRTGLIRALRQLAPADPETAEPEAKRFLAALIEPKPPAGVGGYRKDLFGFVDIMAYRLDQTLAVQTTSFQEMAPHIRDFRDDDELRVRILDWIRDEHRSLVIHGWRCMEVPLKRGSGTKAQWQLTERTVEPADLEAF